MARLIHITCTIFALWACGIGFGATGVLAQTSPPSERVEVTIGYEAGWSLLALPVNTGNDLSPNEAFPDAAKVLTYEADSLRAALSVEVGSVYWVQHDEAGSKSFEGERIERQVIDLEPGWTPVPSITGSVEVDSISSSTQGVNVKWFSVRGGQYQAAETLYPGSGYWAYVSTATTITLGAAAPTFADDVVEIDDTAVLISNRQHPDAGRLVLEFLNTPPALETGDIIIGRQQDGFLREVVSVSSDQNTLTITTRQPSLAEAYPSSQLSSSIGFNVGTAQPVGGPGTTGDLLPQQTRSLHPRVIANANGFTFDQLELGSATDFSLSVVSGSLDGNLRADVDIITNDSSVECVRATLHGTLDLELNVGLDAAVSQQGNAEVRIGEIRRRFALNGVPAVARVELFAAAEYDIRRETSYTFGYSASSALRVGFDCDGGVFEPSLSVDSRDLGFASSSDFDVQMEIRPRLTVQILDVLGPFVEVDNYLRLEGSTSNDDWDRELFGGVRGRGGVELNLSSLALLDWSAVQQVELFDRERSAWRTPDRLSDASLSESADAISTSIRVSDSASRGQEGVTVHYFIQNGTSQTRLPPEVSSTDGRVYKNWTPPSESATLWANIRDGTGSFRDAYGFGASVPPARLEIVGGRDQYVKPGAERLRQPLRFEVLSGINTEPSPPNESILGIRLEDAEGGVFGDAEGDVFEEPQFLDISEGVTESRLNLAPDAPIGQHTIYATLVGAGNTDIETDSTTITIRNYDAIRINVSRTPCNSEFLGPLLGPTGVTYNIEEETASTITFRLSEQAFFPADFRAALGSRGMVVIRNGIASVRLREIVQYDRAWDGQFYGNGFVRYGLTLRGIQRPRDTDVPVESAFGTAFGCDNLEECGTASFSASEACPVRADWSLVEHQPGSFIPADDYFDVVHESSFSW
jgi:hypothetical protein